MFNLEYSNFMSSHDYKEILSGIHWVENLTRMEKKMNLYYLQFADSLKITKHDIVYLFNETGAGKTITAGMSVLNLNDFKKCKEVLVITSSDSVAEQFRNDWNELLPFKEYDISCKFINHDYRNIKKPEIQNKVYDVVVIDEAHTMININHKNRKYKNTKQEETEHEKTERYDALEKIKAKKVIFMTATPIRYGSGMIHEYYYLGCQILQKADKLNQMNIKKLNSYSQEHFLPETLNLNFPVSRYMKDTVERTHTDNAVILERAEPIIAEALDRFVGAADVIENLVQEGHRCLVFIDTVNNDKEHNKISQRTKLETLLSEKKIPYCYIPAGEKAKLRYFDVNSQNFKLKPNPELYPNLYPKDEADEQPVMKEKLPPVLILTKFAETGINLSAFDRIVNVSLSPVPATLEQRFGRIDRILTPDGCKNMMGLYGVKSLAELNIASAFICCRSSVSASNFNCAINEFVNHCLAAVPSRNIMLTRKLLEVYRNANDETMLRRMKIEEIKRLITLKWEPVNDKTIVSEQLKKLLSDSGETKENAELQKLRCSYEGEDDAYMEFVAWVEELGIVKPKGTWKLERTQVMTDYLLLEEYSSLTQKLEEVSDDESLKEFLLTLYIELRKNQEARKELCKSLEKFQLQNENMKQPWNNVFYNDQKNIGMPNICHRELSVILQNLQKSNEYQKFKGAFDAYIKPLAGFSKPAEICSVPPGFYPYHEFSELEENWNLKMTETAKRFVEHVRNSKTEYENYFEVLKNERIYAPLYVWYVLYRNEMTENLPEYIAPAMLLDMARKYNPTASYNDEHAGIPEKWEKLIDTLNTVKIKNEKLHEIEELFENCQVSDLDTKIQAFSDKNFYYAVAYVNQNNHLDEISGADMFCAYAEFCAYDKCYSLHKKQELCFYKKNYTISTILNGHIFILFDRDKRSELEAWLKDFYLEN